MSDTRSVTVEPGFLVIDHGSGPPVAYPIKDVIRQPDVPVGLTHTQVDGIRLLANMTAILIRTLVDREILDETFADELGMDWDLDHIIYALEQLGGSYHNPDFDDVEVA